MTRNSYSPEQKAEALAAMALGESIRHAAARLDIPVGTMSVWRDELKNGPVGAVVTEAQTLRAARNDDEREDLGALVGDYLGEGLRTLRAQAVFARDRAWLEKQNAADLAIFHGVLADKLIRVLSALKPDG